MKVIDFHDNLGKGQAAFVIFYCSRAQPWKSYEPTDSVRQKLVFPVCLMINRADGAVGFIGGMVETGETLEQAAIREVKEEIGYNISVKLEPLVAHDIGPITTHAFIAEMAYEELRNIQETASKADHFGSEVTGIFLPHLTDYDKEIGKGGGLINLIKSSMAPSVREELVHFLVKKNILDKDSLEDLCQQAGFNLDALLQ